MKLKTVVILAILLVAMGSTDAQQPDVKQTAANLGKGLGELAGWITKAADMVPADKYSYKPAPTVRTFGELVGHIADGYNYFCARATGKKVQWSDAVEKGKTDKATIVEELKKATNACSTAYATGGLDPLIQNFGHTNLHYGNVITYMRMLGLVPPSTS
jgi:uncharacterized damage-inducible protein DinB